MTWQLILTIGIALAAQFGAFKIQKTINDHKVKRLNSEIEMKDNRIEGLEKEKEQRDREQVAGAAHRERVVLSRKEKRDLEKKIDRAYSPEEIKAILKLIDEDNNFKVREK